MEPSMSPALKAQSREPLNLGVALSVAVHAAVIGYLLYLVHPQPHFLELPKLMPTVELTPPAPPAPPKPRVQPQQKPVPQQQAPQPDQLQARAADAPPAAAAPPAPPQLTGTVVPPSYFGELQALIRQSLVYPSRSVANDEEGVCKVRVSFSRDGGIHDAQLVQNSGYTALDGECREVFRRIGRFPPVPPDTSPNATDFSIELPITYSLQQ
jgi:protein TonB